MNNYKISPSGINLMNECQRCFWLSQHKLWKRPNGPMSSLPSGMDLLLKNYFDTHINKGILPFELQEIEGITLFDNKELLKEWRSNFKGIRYTDTEGNTLFGAVDNILVCDGKLIVLDYKTRGFPLKEIAEAYTNQVSIYHYLLQKNGYETTDYAYLLFYIPKNVKQNGEISFDTKLISIPINTTKAETLYKKALTVLNQECPEQTCTWCEQVSITTYTSTTTTPNT